MAPQIAEGEKLWALLWTLRAFEDQPQAFYQPVEKSVRVFPTSSGLLTMKKEVRRLLTSDWAEYDLRSAQLAICAALWQVDSVRVFLKEGGHIWQSLFEHMGLDYERADRDMIKGPLKKAVYSLVFGMRRRGIARELSVRLAGRVHNPARKFFSHPVIGALYKARGGALERISAEGGAQDCFGRWIALDANREGPERSVMAQLAQAAELQLLLPVLELARTTDQFDVMLWSHDGFSVAYRDASKRERWEAKLIEAVSRNAEALGIPTVLEVS